MNLSAKSLKRVPSSKRKNVISAVGDKFSLGETERLIEKIELGFQKKSRHLNEEAKLPRAVKALNVELANISLFNNQTPKNRGKVEHCLDLLERAEMLRKQIAFDALLLRKTTLDWMIKRKMAKAVVCDEVQKIGLETDALKESIENDCFNVGPRVKGDLFALRASLAEFEFECLMMPEPSYFKEEHIQAASLLTKRTSIMAKPVPKKRIEDLSEFDQHRPSLRGA